ncbi:MAG: DUF3182 family protein [Porticoccaceae bacterium]|jgi:hypothetical protein
MNAEEKHVTKSGVVVLATSLPAADHERSVQCRLAKEIATLLHCPFLGDSGAAAGSSDLYYIPAETLVIYDDIPPDLCEEDFFGGLVCQPYVATKAISHPLYAEHCCAPSGWMPEFLHKAGNVVLDGYTAFSLEDAGRAGSELLRKGPVRLKPVQGKAGKGQQVVATRTELETALAQLPEDDIARWGLVLEEHLREVITWSVGQIRVAGGTVSYVGSQNLTRDNGGQHVYGGSELLMVRGGYENLLGLKLSPALLTAVFQARNYEQAAFEVFEGLVLSRRNYDIAQGLNGDGNPVSGVLEQSWRIGGATSAEIFGLKALGRDPDRQYIRAASLERYGESYSPPEGATVLFSGEDKDVGFITKCVRVAVDERQNRTR